jgi:reverse gyrase
MKSLVITPKNDGEFKFLTDLLKKLQVKASALSQDELEDLGMSKLMHEVDKSKKVSRAEIMKKLFNNSFRQVCS